MWPADNQKVTLSDLNYMQLVPLTNHPRVFLVEDFLSPTEVAMLVDAAVNGDVKLKPGRVGFSSAGNRTSHVGFDNGR